MSKNHILSIVCLSAIVALAFQNCSKVGVSDIGSAPSQKLSFEQVLDEEAKDAMNEPPAPAPAPAQDSPVVDMPIDPEEADKDKDKDKEPPSRPVVDDEIPDVEEPSEEEVAALCLKAKDNGKSELHRVKLAEISSGQISNLRGHHVVESALIELIENFRGKLIVKAKADGAVIKKIVDTRGALIICGMDVDSIDNTRGHIVLVNSRVKMLSNHRGNVKLLGSEILQTSDVKGNIKEIQAK